MNIPSLKLISTLVKPTEVRDALNSIVRMLGSIGKEGGAVTTNDLVQGGLATVGPGGQLIPRITVDTVIPPAPQDLVAVGGFSIIMLSWENTTHRYLTEIFRATIDDLSQAVKAGETGAHMYADTPPNNATSVTYYYWVRFLNGSGVEGPFNQIAGTSASTADDPGYMLELLAGQITTTELSTSLATEIDKITTIGGDLSALAADVATLGATDDYDAEVTYQPAAMVKYNGGLYRAILETLGNLPTNITYWEKIGDYSSLGEAVAAHTAELDDHESRIVATEGGLSAEISDRETLAAQVRGTYEGSDVAQVTSGIIYSERVARAAADNSMAQNISSLSTTVGGHTTTIESVIATQNGLSAQWTAKIDNNGFMTGFGLSSTPATSAPTSDFTVMADRFSVINPNTTPFTLSSVTRSGSTATGTTTTAHGRVVGDYVVVVGCEQPEYNGTKKLLTVPNSTTFTYAVTGTPATPATGISKKVGVAVVPFVLVNGIAYFNVAMFKEATITSAMISSLAADKVDAATLSAITADLGAITAGSMNINNRFIVAADGTTTIQSATSGERCVQNSGGATVYDQFNRIRFQYGLLTP